MGTDEWEKPWVSWHKCLNSPNWREFAWRLRMRYCKTTLVISNCDNKSSPLCWRGYRLTGDSSHIFWDCPKLQVFWKKVMRDIAEILELNILFEPQKLILGNIPLRGLGKNKTYMLRDLVLVAHNVITLNWLKHNAVNFMEYTTAKLQIQMEISSEMVVCYEV